MSDQPKCCLILGDGLHYATPILSSTKTSELEVIRCILRMMQGLSSSLFYWDKIGQSFCVAENGIYVTHLSYTSLHNLLNQFLYSATCLQLVQLDINRLKLEYGMPTLRAFASSVSQWLERLREIALKEEVKICNSNDGVSPTLLRLSSSLSSLCSGAECLLQIVHGAIPHVYFEVTPQIPASEIAVHILDHLYKKLDEVCLVQGGKEDTYLMVIHILVRSLLPYIDYLDSWLIKGTLDDPFEEMFFYANNGISIDESDFLEKSHQMRQIQSQKSDVEHVMSFNPLANNGKAMKENDSVLLSISEKGKEQSNNDPHACPLFFKNIAKSIISAGKSLQMICHVPESSLVISGKSIDDIVGSDDTLDLNGWQHSIEGLTLSEIFCLSVAGLICEGDLISKYLLQDDPCKSEGFCTLVSKAIGKPVDRSNEENLPACLENIHKQVFIDKASQMSNRNGFSETNEGCMSLDNALLLQSSFCPNPVLTMCQSLLDKHKDSWEVLNLSHSFHLPSLNDGVLQEALFGCENRLNCAVKGTNHAFGFQFGESQFIRSQDDKKMLEVLFPFPTVLPFFQDGICMSELLPVQKNSTLASRFLSRIQNFDPRKMPLPSIIVQECLTVYIKKQVDYIGQLVLSKLMKDWRLMDELAILRAIYLLGSGDLLHHFLTIIFSKLDEGEIWDDDFELNLILQESIANSAYSKLLRAPDSLYVSISKNYGVDNDEQPSMPTLTSIPYKNGLHSSKIDGLSSLKFTYEVSWPLKLIVNTEVINKYNQVMRFLLKVKRAKFVLDKVCRWMWKGRGTATNVHKHHCLVEKKLLHFVNALHHYVESVFHSSWHELCEGIAKAGSLDEVIEAHEAYLLSIQRQCFVVPDKLWVLIASRIINSILGLALDFYSTQQILFNGGANSAICERKVDKIEREFDECIAFLLRILPFKQNVGHFPHLGDLVTIINYNNFYMSDTGNLVTATASETVTSEAGGSFWSQKGQFILQKNCLAKWMLV